MSGLLQFILSSLWHGLLFVVAVLVAALGAKLAGPPITEYLQVHESIPTAVVFFGVLGLGGWLYNRFGPKNGTTIIDPQNLALMRSA
jgi:hypothetical protein